ncbi:MAG: mannosyltransferase [Pleopsidium flavum]|nr:MAG: mannosyltransferase [Pleopsidium flavum]
MLLLLPSRYVPLPPAAAREHLHKQAGRENKDSRNAVQILVLGDIGRSPRMQYHAISIAKHGAKVTIIGYQETDLHPELTSDPLISTQPLSAPPRPLQTSSNFLFLVFAPLKVMWQMCSLWLILGYRTKPARWLLVQNPPSIPTLAIAQIMCFLRNTQLVIDWHNFGHSILALKLGSVHPLVKVSMWYESTFSHTATAHFTVTNAMARTLRQDYHITSPILPLHDRPAVYFQPLTNNERLTFLGNLPLTAPHVNELDKGSMKLVVSATSWTPDEDFSLLVDALVRYSELATSSHPHLPELLAIVTGKGPQKEYYLSQIARLEDESKLEMVTIKTAWLSTEDYASLLGAADLGVSLHMSSSGVDLPMKVVDMFGAGLPVVGWDRYEAWPELVTEGVNGRGFGSAEGLEAVLVELFGGDGNELRRLKEGAVKEGERRWDEEWEPVAGRLLGLC